MATFRCTRSGNTIEVTDDTDLVAIRKHESYTEVVHEASTDAPVKVAEAPETKVLKKRGRPPNSARI